MIRPALLAVALASAGCATASVALAADGPVTQAPGPPTGTRQIVLRAQSFHVIDNPPRRSHDGPPSPGDASITRYRVLDPAGTRIGSAQFVCVATDRRGQHEQCSGTIALPDGQIATQGDADNMAVVGGSRSYARARGPVTRRAPPRPRPRPRPPPPGPPSPPGSCPNNPPARPAAGPPAAPRRRAIVR